MLKNQHGGKEPASRAILEVTRCKLLPPDTSSLGSFYSWSGQGGTGKDTLGQTNPVLRPGSAGD